MFNRVYGAEKTALYLLFKERMQRHDNSTRVSCPTCKRYAAVCCNMFKWSSGAKCKIQHVGFYSL